MKIKLMPVVFLSLVLAGTSNAQEPPPTPAPTATPAAAQGAATEQGAAAAQGAAAEQGAAAATSQDILTWKIYSGLQTQFRRPRSTDFTYRVRYKDEPIGKQGEDLSFLDVTGEFGKPGLEEETDTSDLLINFEQGEGVSESGLLDFLNVNEGFPFKFKPLKSYPFRTATQAGANIKAKTYSVALGIETPSFKLSQIGIGDGTTLSNWLTFGLAANQKWRPAAAGGDKFSGIVTYRGFIGKAWGFRQVKELGFTLEQVLDSQTGIAPTFQKLQEWVAANPMGPNPSELVVFLHSAEADQDFIDAENNPPTDNAYMARVTRRFKGLLSSTYERDPSLAIHFESAGWYNLSRVPNEKQLNSGTSLALTKWFSAGKTVPRSSVQARLDYGRAFSNATQPQRTASVVFGLNF